MINKIFLLFLFAGNFGVKSIAQQANDKDSIKVVKHVFSGLKFYQGDKRITMRQLNDVMRPDKEAFRYLNKAKTNFGVAFITALAAGFCIGYEIGSLAGANDINWGVMAAGAGFLVITIPFDAGFRRNVKKAVYLYNAPYR